MTNYEVTAVDVVRALYIIYTEPNIADEEFVMVEQVAVLIMT